MTERCLCSEFDGIFRIEPAADPLQFTSHPRDVEQDLKHWFRTVKLDVQDDLRFTRLYLSKTVLHTSHGNCTKLSLPISLIGQLDDYLALSEDSAELLHPEAGSEVLSKALKCLEQVSCGTELDGAKSAADKSEPGVTAFRGEIWLDTETARAARLLAGELRSKLEHVRSLQQSVQAELSALYSEECEPVSRNASFTEASTTLQ